MTIHRCFVIGCTLLSLPLVFLANVAGAQSKSSKHAFSEPNSAQLCKAANTCGSSSNPCVVDVKRTGDGASSTPNTQNAKSNTPFCVTSGTTVTWKNTAKNIGFIVDPGTPSPFEPAGAIIGGSDDPLMWWQGSQDTTSILRDPCMSGAIYGMCKETSAEVIVIGGK